MFKRAFAGSVPCAWVTGDNVYGADYALLYCIEQYGRGYVMAATSAQRLALRLLADWLEEVAAKAWRWLSASYEAKGCGFMTRPICPAARQLCAALSRTC